jgi:hypothetical protein
VSHELKAATKEDTTARNPGATNNGRDTWFLVDLHRMALATQRQTAFLSRLCFEQHYIDVAGKNVNDKTHVTNNIRICGQLILCYGHVLFFLCD